jgi:hypothetical protein
MYAYDPISMSRSHAIANFHLMRLLIPIPRPDNGADVIEGIRAE